jgi:hypothetical protein
MDVITDVIRVTRYVIIGKRHRKILVRKLMVVSWQIIPLFAGVVNTPGIRIVVGRIIRNLYHIGKRKEEFSTVESLTMFPVAQILKGGYRHG